MYAFKVVSGNCNSGETDVEKYRIYLIEMLAWANSVEPVQENAASDQDLHCLALIKQLS